jgi:lysophospholipase L1-like esterase
VRCSPLALLLARWVQAQTSVIPQPPSVGEPLAEPASDPRLEAIYRNNIAALHALNRSRQVTPIFVGQVLNRSQLTAETSYGWLPRVQDRHVWDLQEHFNGILQAEAAALGAEYIDVDGDTFEPGDFVDQGHFSESGASKFAAILYPQVAQRCR